jgi:tRNA threonylcarbamoyl adenosine modification protein YeaZ
LSILAIDAAGPLAGVAVLAADGSIPFRGFVAGQPGLITTLPVLLAEAAETPGLTEVAVTLGPGSFTGLRTAIALAQGFAAARGLPLDGITAFEAYTAGLPGLQRTLWVAARARRGRLFLMRGGSAEAFADEDLPRNTGPVALAGDAAAPAAARLAATGADVMLTDARQIDPLWVALATAARRRAHLPYRDATPLYVDPPEAKSPAGLRPPPA